MLQSLGFTLFHGAALNLLERPETASLSSYRVAMRKALNELVVSKAPFAEKGQYCIWDPTVRGFALRCSTHSKTWVLKQGQRWHTLGRYPIITLKQARDEAKRRLALKYFPHQNINVHEAVREFLIVRQDTLKPTTQKLYRIYLRRLDRPVQEIDARYVYSILPEGKVAPNVAFNVIKAFLSWCVERDYIQANPLLKRKQPNKLKSRDRLLTNEEIRLIWHESHNHQSFGAIVRLLILSGQRLSQISSLQHTWLSASTIVFPPYIMKSNAEHVIPLTPHVSSILLELSPTGLQCSSHSTHQPIFPSPNPNTNYLFPTHRGGNLSHSMKVFRKALNAKPPYSEAASQRNTVSNGIPTIPHFTLHDFRRYFSSTCAKLGIPIDITEAILAHTSGSRSQIQRTYDRYDRLEPMRSALEQYQNHVLKVVEH